MIQDWTDYVDTLSQGGKVINGNFTKRIKALNRLIPYEHIIKRSKKSLNS